MDEYHCACCGKHDIVEIWESSLYNPGISIDLCMSCGEKEEMAIEVAGTNDIPELLATYKFLCQEDE